MGPPRKEGDGPNIHVTIRWGRPNFRMKNPAQTSGESYKEGRVGGRCPRRRWPSVGRPARSLLAPVGRPLYSRTSCDDPGNEKETTSPPKTTPMTGVYQKMKRLCPRVEQMAVSRRNVVSHRCFQIGGGGVNGAYTKPPSASAQYPEFRNAPSHPKCCRTVR